MFNYSLEGIPLGDYRKLGFKPATELLYFLLNDNKYKDSLFIAGGHSRWLCDKRKRPSQDIDIYPLSMRDGNTNLMVFQKEFLALLSSKGIKVETSVINAVPTIKVIDTDEIFQFIPFKIANSIDELLHSFDFSVCQFANNSSMIFKVVGAQEDLDNNILRFTPEVIKHPKRLKSRFYRVMKYLEKGFQFPSVEEATLFFTGLNWPEEELERAAFERGGNYSTLST